MSRTWKFLLSFAIFASVCYVGLMWFVNNEVGKGINQAVADTPGMALSYSDLSVSLRDHSVTLTGVETVLPDGQHFTADMVRITRFDQLNPVPHFATVEAMGMEMDVTFANFGTWAAPLMTSGKETLTGDVGLEYNYDPQAQALTVNELVVKADDLCDLTLSGTITQLDLGALRMEKLLGLRMKDMTLAFTNHSIVDTMLHDMAAGLGMTDGAARTQVGAELGAMADYAGKEGNTIAENALRGLKRFMDNPGSITISARPAEPVPYLYFFMGRDIYDNLRLLNLSVTTDSGDDI